MNVCMYVRMYVCVFIIICMYVYTYVCTCTSVPTYVRMYVFEYVCTCMYVLTCILCRYAVFCPHWSAMVGNNHLSDELTTS